MANEFKLSYTASQVNEKLGEIENLAKKSEIPSKLSQLVNDGGFATESYVDSAIENIDFPETDLSDYALKSEIPTNYLTEIPAEYVTESELNAKGYLTQHQSLAGLATETFVNEGLATKQPVGDYALKSDIPTDYLKDIPSEYVTEYELNSKGYLTEQSLDGLASETFVVEQISTKADSEHNHSWNELEDRPFGTRVECVKDTIVFDGVIEGKTYVEIEEGTGLIKLSDIVPTVEELAHGWIETTYEGDVLDFSQDGTYEELLAWIQEIQAEYNGAFIDEYIYIIPTDNFDLFGMCTIPEAGIYTMCAPDMNLVLITSLTIVNFERFNSEMLVDTPIELKYLPKSHQYGQDMLREVLVNEIEFPDNTDGLHCVEYDGCTWYRVCEEPILAGLALNGYTVYGVGVPNNNKLTGECQYINTNGAVSHYTYASGYVMSFYSNVVLNSSEFKRGVYFKVDASGNKVTLMRSYSGLYRTYAIAPMPIDETYIPDTIVRRDQFGKLAQYVFSQNGANNDTNYATKEYVNEGLATKQPVGDYALKSDIPTDYLRFVPAEYVTESELNSKGYLTKHQSLDGLATETFVIEQMSGKANEEHEHSYLQYQKVYAKLPTYLSKIGWRSLTYGNGKFVAFSTYASDKAAYSEDGINWLEATLPASIICKSATYGDGKFVAVGYESNKVLYSEDGINWFDSTLPIELGWSAVTYGNGKFVALASSSSRIAISEDGIVWSMNESSLPNHTTNVSIAYGNDKFVVKLHGGYEIMYSDDCANWTTVMLPSYVAYNYVTYANDKFIVFGPTNNCAWSEDGINWNASILPESKEWLSIAYGNGKFVALTYNSNVSAYSKDGINWTPATLCMTGTWYSIAYGNGKFIALNDNSNTAIYSEDGINWRYDYDMMKQDNVEVKLEQFGCATVSYVNDALAKAKESGDFGGYTPVRGTDYWTEADKAEIKSYVEEAILGGAW